METSEKQPVKPRFWFGFSIGLMVGLVFSVVFYFVDKSLNDPIKLLVSTPAVADKAEPEEESEPETSPYIGKKISADRQTTRKPAKDTLFSSAEDSLMADVDFALDNMDEAADIYQEKCLTRKNVSVKPWKSDDNSSIPSFEVEEWSETAMNKISYYRHGNTLKIKGLKIQNIKIWVHDGLFYLENNGRFYAIPENDDFRRLTSTSIPNA